MERMEAAAGLRDASIKRTILASQLFQKISDYFQYTLDEIVFEKIDYLLSTQESLLIG